MPNQYPKALKYEVTKRHEDGESVSSISRDVHVPLSTLYRWFQKYRTIQTPQRKYSPAEFDALLKRAKKAEHLLEIIRATECVSAIPLQTRLQKLSMLYEQDTGFSVHEICEALEVSRGTFYNHIFRRVDRSKHQQEQERLMQAVQQVFDDSNQRFGSEKIRITLAANGIHVSRERIQGIMQELDIKSILCNAKREYKRRQYYRKRNLLNRNFTASKPNQIWVSDITYFKVKGYGLYLCVILDLLSRKVIAYNISRKASTYLVTSTFREAFALRHEPRSLVFHSDRGTQYTSNAFTQLLLQNSVQQSFSASGRPLDNAVSETFFATFKKEEAYRRDYLSERDFRKSVDEYIQFYNEIRPHKTLAYKTPVHFEELYGK